MKPFYEDNLERIDDVKHCLLSEERATIIEPAHIDVVKNGQLWNQPVFLGHDGDASAALCQLLVDCIGQVGLARARTTRSPERG